MRRLAGALLLVALPLVAQAPHDAPGARPRPVPAGGENVAEGQVVRQGGGLHDPVANAWVVLHRVGQDRAGPLDSVRTGADGRYRFRYRRTGEESALYFASTMYAGIAYFAPPFRGSRVSGEEAEITVFDTMSAPVPLRAEGRHFVVGASHDGSREILEVYELANDTNRTLVSAPPRPVWRAPVVPGAGAFVPGEGESGRGALDLRAGFAELYAPVPPGIKQVSFRYQLADSRFPLTIAVQPGTGVLEVLVEEPNAKVKGAGLKETASGEQEGRRFRRFLSQDPPKGSEFTVDLGTERVGRSTILVAGTLGVLLLMVGGLVFSSRRQRAG